MYTAYTHIPSLNKNVGLFWYDIHGSFDGICAHFWIEVLIMRGTRTCRNVAWVVHQIRWRGLSSRVCEFVTYTWVRDKYIMRGTRTCRNAARVVHQIRIPVVTWLVHMCDMTHSCVTWLIHTCGQGGQGSRLNSDPCWDMTHAYVWYGTFTCVIWHIHMCDMTHPYVWHVSFIYAARVVDWIQIPVETWLVHMCDMTHSYVWHDSFICATWRIHMCNMTHSYVWHDSFICATWRIHMCDMSHSYVWHDAFICVTWRIHMCDMTHSYVWHDAFICVTW